MGEGPIKPGILLLRAVKPTNISLRQSISKNGSSPKGNSFLLWQRGWSGGVMVLGKLPVLGRPTNLDYSRARAYCAYSRCGWGWFGHFYSHLSFLSSFSLSLGDGPI